MQYLLFFAAILAFMYLVLVRPQQQRLRKQQALVRAVTVGEYVVLQSGIVGRVADETAERLHLEIADGVLVEVLKVAVFRKMEPSELVFTTAADGEGEEAAEAQDEEAEGEEAEGAEAEGAEAGALEDEGEVAGEAAGGEIDDQGAEGELEVTGVDDAGETGARGNGWAGDGTATDEGATVTSPEQDTH